MKRLEYLTEQFGQKAAARFLSYEAPQQKEIAQEVVRLISELDPTKNKKFTQWLLREYSNGAFTLAHIQKEQVFLLLQNFQSFKQALSGIDLYTFSWKGLKKTLVPYLDGTSKKMLSKKEIKSVYRTRLIKSGQVNEFYCNKSSNTRVLRLNSKEAAVYYGRGTQWCVSGKEYNEFSNYQELGNLFFIQYRGAKFLFQMQFHKDKIVYNLADCIDEHIHLGTSTKNIFPFRPQDIEFGKILELLMIWEGAKYGVSIKFSHKVLLDCMLEDTIVYQGLLFFYKTKKLDNKYRVSSSKDLMDRSNSFMRLMNSLSASYSDSLKMKIPKRLTFTPPVDELKEVLPLNPYYEFIFKLNDKLLTDIKENPKTSKEESQCTLHEYCLAMEYLDESNIVSWD